jgi:hypothetical protein
MEERIAFAMLHHPTFREAFEKEGLDPRDWLLATLVSKERGKRRGKDRLRGRSRL